MVEQAGDFLDRLTPVALMTGAIWITALACAAGAWKYVFRSELKRIAAARPAAFRKARAYTAIVAVAIILAMVARPYVFELALEWSQTD